MADGRISVMSPKVVLCEYVGPCVGGMQQICGGVCGVCAAHMAEIAVGTQYGVGIAPVSCQHEFNPRYGVKQAAFKQGAVATAVRKIL